MRISRSLVALPVTLILGLTLGGPIAVADPRSSPGSKASLAGTDHRAERAEQALADVEALVSGNAATRGGRTADGRDLTVALRDLRLQMGALSPADRRVAERFFLRPGHGSDPYISTALPYRKCSTDICIHWTETGVEAPDGPGLDNNGATVPPYITQVLNTVQQINDDYVAAGYRTPVRDGTKGGGTDKVDIYIGDIGSNPNGWVLYGFCTTDDPKSTQLNPSSWDVWAYCALDNDYSAQQFGTLNTPTENMQVTAAHEYFHAVQYAYDYGEDGWIIESTATWAEDEMFDAVNDNRQYLADSPMSHPGRSIDRFGRLFHYGVWIWWRYLTEKFPGKTGRLPNLVLAVWKRLDGAAGGPDKYSTQGLAQVLGARDTSLKKEMQLFQAANRHPGTVYSEGGAYKASPADLKLALSRAHRERAGESSVDHLSSATVRFTPKELSRRDWKIRLSFDLPRTARGASAVVVVYKKSGEISTHIVSLNRTGGGRKTVPFSSRSIAGVDAVLVNTSAQFNCPKKNRNSWRLSPFSCSGEPKDDDLAYKVTGRAFRS